MGMASVTPADELRKQEIVGAFLSNGYYSVLHSHNLTPGELDAILRAEMRRGIEAKRNMEMVIEALRRAGAEPF